MDNPWQPSHAILPLTYTTLLFTTALLYFSFPLRINHHATLACVTLFAYLAFTSSDRLLPDAIVEDTFCRTILIFTAHMWHIAGSRAVLVPGGAPYDPQATLLRRYASPWRRGYKLLFNGRGIGTTWEISQLRRRRATAMPPRPEKKNDNTKSPPPVHAQSPSRAWPLTRCTFHILLLYLLLCLWQETRWTAFLTPPLSQSDLAPTREVLIRRVLGFHPDPVTSREVSVRIRMLLNFVLPDYLKLSLLHSVLALLAVVSGLDDSDEWPPLFGTLPVSTVRAFWGQFWHALVLASFSAHAKVVLSWFGIRGRGTGVRLVQNALVFCLSAVLHGVVDVYLMECGGTRSLLWWVLQPVAFVVEGVVGWVWVWFMGGYRGSRVVRWFERVVGWVWVFGWFFWGVPKMVFPLYNCEVGG